MTSEARKSMLHGILLIALFSCAAFYITDFEFIKKLSFSPLIVGIVLGMLYANSLRNNLPETWVPGIKFCSKQILRIGIILYGFRLTFQSVIAVGTEAVVIDLIVVVLTLLFGISAGKLLKMDKDISLLTATGSAICGAAAVLGAESVIRPQPYKTAVAVSTVVVFGTIAMFIYPALYNAGAIPLDETGMGVYTGSTIYPALYNAGAIPLDETGMGVYTGSTLHEVAHVVGAGNAMGENISDTAIIVKMIRVILLAPVLLVMSFFTGGKPAAGEKRKVTIPWFAFGFIAVIGFNSLGLLPASAVEFINSLDTFLLTMAMTALGAETGIEKFKQAGAKPFLLATILFIWLTGGGYLLAKYLGPLL